MSNQQVAQPKAETRFEPPSKAFTVEFMVGLFTLFGVGCLAYLAIGIASMSFFDTGSYDIIAEFDNISGLENGAPVEIAGVPVGSVKRIALSDTMASVTLKIVNNVPVREDDIVTIRTKGIIGDRYVRIIPGASASHLKAGASVQDTEGAVDIEEIIGKLIHRME